METNHKSELIDRAKAKQKEIEASIHRAKADSKNESNSKIEEMENSLGELKASIKNATDDFSEAAAKKLNSWLK